MNCRLFLATAESREPRSVLAGFAFTGSLGRSFPAETQGSRAAE